MDSGNGKSETAGTLAVSLPSSSDLSSADETQGSALRLCGPGLWKVCGRRHCSSKSLSPSDLCLLTDHKARPSPSVDSECGKPEVAGTLAVSLLSPSELSSADETQDSSLKLCGH